MISPLAFALSLFSPHHVSERGSISAGRVPPVRLVRPIPSTRTKAENEEGRKRLRWGVASEGELSRPSRERARREKLKEERTEESPTRREGEGRRQGENASAPRATHHILLSRLPTLTAEAPFDEERHT